MQQGNPVFFLELIFVVVILLTFFTEKRGTSGRRKKKKGSFIRGNPKVMEAALRSRARQKRRQF